MRNGRGQQAHEFFDKKVILLQIANHLVSRQAAVGQGIGKRMLCRGDPVFAAGGFQYLCCAHLLSHFVPIHRRRAAPSSLLAPASPRDP